MQVRLYRASKSAMQSGRKADRMWHLEGEPATPRLPNTLNGWAAAGDTCPQVRLRFASREAALRYAERRGWTCDTVVPNERRVTPRNYADTFKARTASSI